MRVFLLHLWNPFLRISEENGECGGIFRAQREKYLRRYALFQQFQKYFVLGFRLARWFVVVLCMQSTHKTTTFLHFGESYTVILPASEPCPKGHRLKILLFASRSRFAL